MATDLQIIHANLLPEASNITDDDMILVIQSGRPKRALPSAMKGDRGDDGKNIELRVGDTAIQWRVKGEKWNTLMTLDELRKLLIDRLEGYKQAVLTQEEFDAISVKDENTMYYVVEE